MRISFGGGGTDISPYPEIFGGAVISTTIDMYSYSTITLIKKNIIKINSKDYQLKKIIQNQKDFDENNELKLIYAILKNFNLTRRGMNVTLFTDTQIGSGLGASSSLTVALIGNLLKIFGIKKSPYEISELAYKIERMDCNIHGGHQDQYSSTFGGFNLMEFSKKKNRVKPLKIRNNVINELLANLILCDTRQVRPKGMYEKIIQTQENTSKNNEEGIQILHDIKKITYKMKNALEKGNLNEFATLLDDGWMKKKSIDKRISNSKIDKIYQLAKNAGATGGKLLGAGGGGYLLLYCDMEKKTEIIKEIRKKSVNITKFNFENSGLVTWKINNGKVI